MDILLTIKADHDETSRALHDLVALVEDASSHEQIAPRTAVLVRQLRIHMAAEERTLYQTALSLEGPLRDAAIAGRIEHDLIERLLDRLELTPPDRDGDLRPLLRVLVDLVQLHGRRNEEEAMFPPLRQELTSAERAALGQAFTVEKERLASTDGFSR